MAALNPAVLKARVTHARSVPVRNSFAYGVDYVLLPEGALAGAGRLCLLSLGRWGLVSLNQDDHGFSGEGGAAWVRGIAAEAGIDDIAEIALLTHPRYWGYAFNPVSFWFMAGRDGCLRAVLAEVHNTFGDRHCYVCRTPDRRAIGPEDWIEAEKRFHVSPFFEIEGRYHFRFVLNERQVGVWIRYDDGKGGGLYTSLIGVRRPLTDTELLRALLRRPLGGAKTMALIHWQALKLFLKGVRYRARPDPSRERVT